MSIPDPIGEIITLLQADAAVTALTAGRVYGGDLATRSGMPHAAVVVKPAGGPGRAGKLRYRRIRIDTVCYGATVKEASDLHVAVREVMEQIQQNGSLFWAQTSSDGVSAIDPTTQWPTCFASYLVMAATES